MGKKDNNEIEIDIQEILVYLRAHWYVLLVSAMVGAMLFYLVSAAVLPKKFQSATKIYVLNQQNQQTVTYTDLQTGTQLTKDYAELVLSRSVTTQVMADLDLQNRYTDMKELTPEQLAGMISVQTLTDTRVIKITVTDTIPTRAQDIANAVRKAASEHIYKVMDIEAVNVVDVANLPEGPSSPNTMKNTAIGFAAGLFIAAAAYTLVFILDDTIKTPDDVERILGVSVLAVIPYDEAADTVLMRKRLRKNRRKKGRKVLDAQNVAETMSATEESMGNGKTE